MSGNSTGGRGVQECRLLIETSGRPGVVGVAVGGVVRSAPLAEARRHARDLTATLKALLGEAGLTPTAVTGVIVGVGPGSYTGLRVGLATAKAFAFAAGVPLVAVPTSRAVAWRTPAEFDTVEVVTDALQGLVYVQRYERTGDGWRPVDELRIEPVARPWPVPVSGPGAGLVPEGVTNVPDGFRRPTADGLYAASLGLASATPEELFALEPLYLRGSSAEEKVKGERGA